MDSTLYINQKYVANSIWYIYIYMHVNNGRKIFALASTQEQEESRGDGA